MSIIYNMARPTRLERVTPTFGGLYSIHLSYERKSLYYITLFKYFLPIFTLE